jgi:hypothetical protein
MHNGPVRSRETEADDRCAEWADSGAQHQFAWSICSHECRRVVDGERTEADSVMELRPAIRPM